MSTKTERQPKAPARPLAALHARFGWTALLVALAYGATIEGLLGFKSVGLLMDPLRREMWSLAHFHAAFLAILNLVYTVWADVETVTPTRRRAASRSLVAGSTLMPLGFFLGGLWHPEGDPGLGIFLVPAGAVLVIYAAAVQALAVWRGR